MRLAACPQPPLRTLRSPMRSLLPVLTLPLLSMGTMSQPRPWTPPSPPPVEELAAPWPAAPAAAPIIAEPQGNWVYQVRVLTTAYTPYDPIDREHGWTGRTSTGVRTAEEPWGIAVDPRAIPYRALVRVPGYIPTRHRGAMAAWLVDDTGGQLRRSWRTGGVIHLDLRFRTRAAATRWGRKWVDVEIEVERPHAGLAKAAAASWRLP